MKWCRMQPIYESDAFAADVAACRTALRTGSRSFLAASLLLPRRVREPAAVLYAFCRLADDAVDLHGTREGTVEMLRLRLRSAYEGRAMPFAADRALAVVVARHGIPAALPEALLEGFEWDVAGRRYEDFADLAAYAARVAGSVGAMMALLMGARTPELVSRACDLGVAMQLSNIARDVGEDARAGRLYLPTRWLREVGIDPDAWLARPVFSEALGTVVGRLLHEADALYTRGAAGTTGLPLSCRVGIHAARLLYAEIGREVTRRGLDSVTGRAVVPPLRKAAVLARSLAAVARPDRAAPWPTLEAVQYLVDAVGVTPNRGRRPPRKNADERIAWVVDLFTRLGERREVQS
jgi:phytoene synthase